MSLLESKGLNKSGITAAPARDYGFVSMQANASTNPRTANGQLESNGINKGGGDRSASCQNEVIPTNDTLTMAVPTEGTVESGGING
jgi:hypothetical protein